MNWTLLIIITASVVVFAILVWLTIGILAIRAARKMRAEVRNDFNKGFDSDFFRNSRDNFRNR